MGEKLFEKFYQPDRVLTDHQPGFGIGLFLVKHFTSAHKGTITYHSEEGKGTLFTLAFLKGSAHFGQEVNITSAPTGAAFISKGKADAVLESQTPAAVAPDADVVTEKKTLLIIDDDEPIRQYLAQLFASSYLIVQAESGEAGLELAEQHQPDLVISDDESFGLYQEIPGCLSESVYGE